MVMQRWRPEQNHLGRIVAGRDIGCLPLPRVIMANAQDQLNALRELAWLYTQLKLWGGPRRFVYAGADAEHSREERLQLKLEMMHANMDASRDIRKARKRLLSTGYPAPDSWLMVEVVGQLSEEYTTAAGKKPEKVVLTDSGVDLKALESVYREMHVAILRMESQTETDPHDDGPSTSRSRNEEYDMPATLTEFIKRYCKSGDNLSDSRLDSIKNSLQNAARRKGSVIRLPKHIGEWKPGQKKYYRPSQLSSVWPCLVERLPNLPPLKQIKS